MPSSPLTHLLLLVAPFCRLLQEACTLYLTLLCQVLDEFHPEERVQKRPMAQRNMRQALSMAGSSHDEVHIKSR